MTNERERKLADNKLKMTVTGFAVLALVLAGCTQEATEEAGSTAAQETEAATTTEVTSDAPAPFSDGTVKIALVENSGAGDYFQQFRNGAVQQFEAMGVEFEIYDAQADNAKQATDMETAIGSGVDAIIVRHGNSDTMCPLINDALDKGIPVVIYDIEVSECAPRAIETSQSDFDLAKTVLTQMAADIGPGVQVGYVNVFGIAPLDRRHVIWEEFKVDNNWEESFFVGKFTNSVATDNAQLVDAALKANSGVTAIFAPYDEFTKGTVSAIDQNEVAGTVSAYGIDISNADIEIMTNENSPWKATAGTDPNAIGAAVVRTMFLHLAGELDENEYQFPGVLITQDFLLENSIANMDDLRSKLPALSLTEVMAADWIPVVTF
jgi:simple sugar transport system substrate-binding protein|tara:strand:- start:4916 stop:6052 length:1137 start_codon:yes stop_codon:yes gene_type:complete